jgi:hypothetical protein
VAIDSKGKFDTQSTLNNEVKCFKCLGVRHIASYWPNKRVVILQDYNEIEIESDNTNDKMPPLEDASDENVMYPIKEESLVIRRTLNVQIKKDDLEQ